MHANEGKWVHSLLNTKRVGVAWKSLEDHTWASFRSEKTLALSLEGLPPSAEFAALQRHLHVLCRRQGEERRCRRSESESDFGGKDDRDWGWRSRCLRRGDAERKPAVGCGQGCTYLAGCSRRCALLCAPQFSACYHGDSEKLHYRADSTSLLHDLDRSVTKPRSISVICPSQTHPCPGSQPVGTWARSLL